MNAQLKTILLTILTLSAFTIALVELSGVSTTAFVNKYGSNTKTIDPELNAMQKKEQELKAMPKTTIEFTETKYSFGTIKEGDVVKHVYHFKNTGSNPLLINNAVASCGCTVPSYPKEPVAPGGEGDITVQFNSHNKEGHQQKNIMIYSNAQEEAMSIGFDADVVKK